VPLLLQIPSLPPEVTLIPANRRWPLTIAVPTGSFVGGSVLNTKVKTSSSGCRNLLPDIEGFRFVPFADLTHRFRELQEPFPVTRPNDPPPRRPSPSCSEAYQAAPPPEERSARFRRLPVES